MLLTGHPIIMNEGVKLVGWAGSSSSSSSSSVHTLPDFEAGDLLLMLVVQTNGSGAMSLNTPSGWTMGSSTAGTNALRRGSILWRRATGTEAATVTLTSGASGAYNIITMVFRGVKNDPVFGTAKVQNSSSTMQPNAAVALAGRKLWLSCTFNESAITAGLTYPSGWGDLITTVGATGTNPARISVLFKESESMIETPGQYSAPSLVPNWISVTMALQ